MILTLEGDTLICISLPQSRFLIKEHYRANEQQSLDSLCELQRLYSDSIITVGNKIITDQRSIIKNDSSIIGFKDYQISTAAQMIKNEHRLARRQGFYKWVASIAGSAATTAMTYFYLTK